MYDWADFPLELGRRPYMAMSISTSARNGHEFGQSASKSLPDRLSGQFRMRRRPGVDGGLVTEPGVQVAAVLNRSLGVKPSSAGIETTLEL